MTEPRLDRRTILAGAAASGAIGLLRPARAAGEPAILRAAAVSVLPGGGGRPARLDLYGDSLPGPTLRLTRGEPARLVFENGLDRPTGLYLQGVRLPNGLDPGGSGPVAPGERRSIAFVPKDSGTYLYRVESGGTTAQDVEGGLAGLLVVAEPGAETAGQEQDLVLTATAGERVDPAAAPGSIAWFANGRASVDLPVGPDGRCRLRLANLAAAYPIEVTLPGRAVVRAVDGQPSEPLESAVGTFLLGPFGRLDLQIELPSTSREPLPILVDTGGGARPMARFVFDDGGAKNAAQPPPSRNPLPGAIPLQNAARAAITIADAAGEPGTKKPPSARQTVLLPGATASGTPPCLTVAAGRSVALSFVNRTGADWSVHWHGFPARLLDAMDDGWKPWWIDSTMLAPGQTARIAFLADNPGRWLVAAQAIGRADDRRYTWFEVT